MFNTSTGLQLPFSKSASSWVPFFLDSDGRTVIYLDVFLYSKQEKVREPFFYTQTSYFF